jgi:hypothetical protein
LDLMPLLHLRKRAPHLIFTFEYKRGYASTCSFDGSLPYGWAGLSREQCWSMPDICRLLNLEFDHGRFFVSIGPCQILRLLNLVAGCRRFFGQPSKNGSGYSENEKWARGWCGI